MAGPSPLPLNCPRCGRPLVYQWSAENAVGELVQVYDCTRDGAFHFGPKDTGLTPGLPLGGPAGPATRD